MQAKEFIVLAVTPHRKTQIGQSFQSPESARIFKDWLLREPRRLLNIHSDPKELHLEITEKLHT